MADHCTKGPLSIFFAVFININIFKCIQIALNTLFFYIHHFCKEKKSVKQRNRPISGPIRSDPVIRTDPVNTRTLSPVSSDEGMSNLAGRCNLGHGVTTKCRFRVTVTLTLIFCLSYKMVVSRAYPYII